MKSRLPVNVENRDLPRDELDRKYAYEKNEAGFINIIFLASLITFIGNIMSIITLRG